MKTYIVNIEYEKCVPMHQPSTHTARLIARARNFKEAQEKASEYLLGYLKDKNPQNTYKISSALTALAMTGRVTADFLVL